LSYCTRRSTALTDVNSSFRFPLPCVFTLTFFLRFPSRSVLTGSYHNYFRIYDVESTNDIVLQADKSAFKAKKIGGVKGGPKGGKGGAATGTMETTGTDFNKKIVSLLKCVSMLAETKKRVLSLLPFLAPLLQLHGSWHPNENTIAIAATNNLFLYSTLT
jgi:serine/threonine-protein phosphatase 2A regulatory subunit B